MTRTIGGILLATTLFMGILQAQMVHTQVPFHSGGQSFFESNSIGWSLRGDNWFANFGGNGPLLPPFGGGDPGGGLSGGFGFAGDGVSGSLRFNFAQGSSRSITSQTPSLTTTNGYPGAISTGVIRPFVTGFTPIVGDFAGATGPLETAARNEQQIRQQQLQTIQRSQTVLRNRKLQQYLQRAARGERDGDKRMIRANYRRAMAIAPEPLRSRLRQRLAWAMQQE